MATEKPKKRLPMSEIIKKLSANKLVGKDSYYDPKKSHLVECIDTGSIIINKVLGLDGIPKGRVTEIYGAESSGKSTLVQTLAVECIKNGGKVLYLDYEQAFDKKYAAEMGIDLDNPDVIQLWQPETFEEGYVIVREFLENSHVDLVVVDSVAAMTPEKILKAEISKELQLGLMARMMTQFISEMTKRISQTNTAMVVVNQIRSRIKTSMYDAGPDTDTTGGRALKFYASIRLELKQKKIEVKADQRNDVDGTKEDKPIGMIVTAINRKNKLAIPYKKADFVIRFGEGIDNVRSAVDIAVNLGLIIKNGAWFHFRKGFPAEIDTEFMSKDGDMQGIEEVRAYLVKHPTVLTDLLNRIYVNADKEVEKESKDADAETTDSEIAGQIDATDIMEASDKILADEAKMAEIKEATKKRGRPAKKKDEEPVSEETTLGDV